MADNENNSVFVNDSDLYYKKTNAVPKPETNIGIDVSDVFYDNLIEAGLASQLDISKINSLTQVSQSRDQIMQLLDTMGQDPIIASALEIYAEDATEYNANGQIMWCESSDPDVAKYINFLLDTLNIDKHIYQWVYSLCKYGDLYLRLYRQSDYNDLLFKNKKEQLNEKVVVKAYKASDKYAHYLEMVPNPAEMFELTKFGKSYAYIKANIMTTKKNDTLANIYYTYQFKEKDVEIYDATNFVHAALEDGANRTPEELELFLDSYEDGKTPLKYNVKRGQSILYNVFKIWRQMMLLENSMLLNRLTKSSITRIVGVEVGDMGKEHVKKQLMRIKTLVEQKTSLNLGDSMEEYTNPGPVINNVYVPTRNGVGQLSTQEIGGDVNVTGLDDVDYFKHRLYGSLRIPGQYLGDTDDNTGFNGGTSLSLISSRYAKMIKRIQNCIIQTITDAINLMLLDKGLNSYVNKFQLRMQSPSTQEELDRQENANNRVNVIQDIMSLLENVDMGSDASKLTILKSLLSSVINDPDVLNIIQERIEELENEDVESDIDSDTDNSDDMDIDVDVDMPRSRSGGLQPPLEMERETNTEPAEASEIEVEPEGEMVLPTPNELGLDFTDSTQF